MSLQQSAHGTGSAYALFKKQLAFALLGLLVFWLGVRIPLHKIRALSGYAVSGTIVLLMAVLAIHTNTRGFLPLGPLAFQPVELAKLGLALWGAHVLVKKKAMLHQYRHLLVPVVPVGLLMLTLVILQPDFGSTVTLGIVLLSLLWFIGAPMRLFVTIVIGAIGGAIALSVGALYRSARWTAFLHPSQDTKGLNYQAIEGKYALADGGLFGQGLGQGAAKYGYLPNVHTDFIFALIGEELGFVGCALILSLYALLIWRGLHILTIAKNLFGALLCGGITVMLLFQLFVNIGMNVGIMPITGVTAPLLSFGGSSMLSTFLALGLLHSVNAQARETAGDQGVDIAGGASTVRQALVAGVVDELTLDIAPVLLGSGERIFDGVESLGMEPVEVLHSPLATHVRYRRAHAA